MIHFLCLPSHCTHLLQPLNVSVMSSLKIHFGQACKQFLSQNIGRIITEGDLAFLVGEAGPVTLTPSNLISGFGKSGRVTYIFTDVTIFGRSLTCTVDHQVSGAPFTTFRYMQVLSNVCTVHNTTPEPWHLQVPQCL